MPTAVVCPSGMETFSGISKYSVTNRSSQLRLLEKKIGVNVQPGFVSFHLCSFHWLPVAKLRCSENKVSLPRGEQSERWNGESFHLAHQVEHPS